MTNCSRISWISEPRSRALSVSAASGVSVGSTPSSYVRKYLNGQVAQDSRRVADAMPESEAGDQPPLRLRA